MGSIKKILKSIFPTPLLKRGFLLYNAVKIRTIDKVLFREYSVPENFYITHQSPCPFNDVELEDIDQTIKGHMEKWKTWTQEEYILRLPVPIVLEPEYGWAFTEAGRLVYQSLSFSRTTHQRKPSLIAYFFRKKEITLPESISLRDTGEENYFHFYNDVIAKLFWLDQYGVSVHTIPVVISYKLWTKSYFQACIGESVFLSKVRWVIQKEEFIRSASTYFVKAPTHKPLLWENIFKALTVEPVGGPLKIFISRSKARLRFLKNADQILSISKQYGFVIIDNDELTFREQINLYARAERIIGIHGSGLTNMYFRNGSCSILEIFPSMNLDYLPFHYIMLAKMKGFKYHAVIGEEDVNDFSGGFSLSPVLFEDAIKRVLL